LELVVWLFHVKDVHICRQKSWAVRGVLKKLRGFWSFVISWRRNELHCKRFTFS